MIVDILNDQGVDLHLDTVVIEMGDVNERSAKNFSRLVDAAHHTGQPFIPLVINSAGGELYSLMAIIDTIGASKLPFITVVEGKAMSCGAVLFTFGEKRFIGPNATLMLHDAILIGGDSPSKTHEVTATAEELARLNAIIWEMMEKNTGNRKKALWNRVHKNGRADLFLDAKQALECKLATNIGIPRWQIQVKVNHGLVFPE